MAGKGGAIPGNGRKSKADEEKVNTLFANALKTFYKVDLEVEAKEKLVHTLLESQRGQIFISEHLFGKPKEIVETTHNVNNFDIREIFKIEPNKNK
jgi:hypothetical protein